MGNSEFIQEVLFEAGAREKETLRLSARVFDLSSLARDIVKGGGYNRIRVEIKKQEEPRLKSEKDILSCGGEQNGSFWG